MAHFTLIATMLSLIIGCARTSAPPSPATATSATRAAPAAAAAAVARVLFTRPVGGDFELEGTVRAGDRVVWTRRDGTPVIGQGQFFEVTRYRLPRRREDRGEIIFRSFQDRVDRVVVRPVACADATTDERLTTVYLLTTSREHFWLTALPFEPDPAAAASRQQTTLRFTNLGSNVDQVHPDASPIVRASIERTGEDLEIIVRQKREPEPRRMLWSIPQRRWVVGPTTQRR